MKLPVVAESRRSAAQQRADAAVFDRVSAILAAGDELMPDASS
jgi:hypothetical protein